MVKVGANPNKAPLQVFHSRVASGLTLKHEARLERLVRDKHSSLIRTFVNFSDKSFVRLSYSKERES